MRDANLCGYNCCTHRLPSSCSRRLAAPAGTGFARAIDDDSVNLSIGASEVASVGNATFWSTVASPLVRARTRLASIDVLRGIVIVLRANACRSSAKRATATRRSSLRPGRDPVLMDLKMPGLPAADAIRTIRAQYPATQVPVLTSYAEDRQVKEVLRAGALGYVLKNIVAADLVRAIATVARGEVCLHAEAQRLLVNRMRRPADLSPLALLTERERSVLRLLAKDMSATSSAQRRPRCERALAADRRMRGRDRRAVPILAQSDVRRRAADPARLGDLVRGRRSVRLCGRRGPCVSLARRHGRGVVARAYPWRAMVRELSCCPPFSRTSATLHFAGGVR